MKAPSDRALRLAAAAALAAWLAVPLYHPDLYWHLSAGRRMLETFALPRRDWLSWTLEGAPWVDFEWLPEVLFAGAYASAGLAGLLALKAALLAGLAVLLWRWARGLGLAEPYAAAGVALAAAASMTRSDLRPEAFSVLGLAGLWAALERARAGSKPPHPAWLAAAFAAWANCHGGFVYGLALLALYAAADRRLRPHLAAAAAGTLLQPTGWGAYRVLWEHWRSLGPVRANIAEWGPAPLRDPWHAAYHMLWPAAIAAASRAAWRRPEARLAAAGLAALAWSSAVQMRDVAYFAAAAPVLGAWFAVQGGWLPGVPGARARWACLAATLACGVYCLSLGSRYGVLRAAASTMHVVPGAADFLEREVAALGGRPLFNRWGWGGYLGWRLHPRYRVFQDGRYIFHPFLAEVAAAGRSPGDWQAFLDRRGVEVAVMENAPLRMRTARRYPDGSTREFWRPYYALFMPRERWALVHWDADALVFARRGRVDGAWLAAREFRWVRPRDEEALADAARLGEAPRAEVEAELARAAATR